MSSISFLPGDLQILDVEAVLDAADSVAEGVAAWPPGAAGVLAREDWRAIATGEVLDLGRLVADLMRRGAAEERWAPGPRDRAIALVERLRARLPEATAFFASSENAAGLRKLKARQLAQRRNDRLREERASKSLRVIEIAVHPGDAAELRAIAAEMLTKRGIKPIKPQPRGRPPKKPTLEDSMQIFFKDTPPRKT